MQDGVEVLDEDQQERFEKVKSKRDVNTKLKALYEACGKPVPDTYCWSSPPRTLFPLRSLFSIQPIYVLLCWVGHVLIKASFPPDVAPASVPPKEVQPHTGMSYWSPADQYSLGHDEGLFDGFSTPGYTGPPGQQQQPTTATNMSRINAVQQVGGSSYAVSGACRPKDADSGYESRTNGGDDIPSAEISHGAPQPDSYWHMVHDTRTYGMSGHQTATTGHGPSHDDFPSAHDYSSLGDGYCQGIAGIDLQLWTGGSSLDRRDDDLRGMEAVAESLTSYTYAEFDDEFPETN
jgi:hypothetical protein